MPPDFKLYSYYRSSCSYRVRIALYLKKINFDYIAIHLLKSGGEQYHMDYQSYHPLSQVPCLVHQDKTLTQSMAIIQYLDAIQPQPLLFPKDPYKKAFIISVCEVINSGIQPLQNLAVMQYLKNKFNLNEDQRKNWNQFWISKGLAAVEMLLKQNNNCWNGHNISAVECCIVPQIYSARRFDVDIQQYPRLLEIDNRTSVMPAFQKAHPDNQLDTPVKKDTT